MKSNSTDDVSEVNTLEKRRIKFIKNLCASVNNNYTDDEDHFDSDSTEEELEKKFNKLFAQMNS